MTTTTAPSVNNKRWLPRVFQRSASERHNADIISTHTNDRVGDTEFFASLEQNSTLAFFHRNELEVGDKLLEKGAFSEVRALMGVKESSTSTRRTSSSLLKRQEIQSSLWVPTNGNPERQQPQYVIKQLSPATLTEADSKTLARAARELVNDAKYLSKLSHHPGIVTLRGITQDAFGRNYLAHQFEDFFLLRDRVSGITLHDKIYKEWRSGEDYYTEPDEDLIPIKANYAFQLAKALRFCHEQGVLYRDLKPANVGFSLLDPQCLQLLEFGLARDIPDPKTQTAGDAPYRMTLAGTRRYLAGEVLTSGEYTWKSDVYSWGMVYYEMSTECKPYEGLSATEHQAYVCMNGDRPSLDDFYFPEALDIILTQSWHPQLHKRWTMDQICEAMQTFLMHLDINYYQQEEGDFLFDIHPTAIPVESWTEELEGLEVDVDAPIDNTVVEENYFDTIAEEPPSNLLVIDEAGEDPEMMKEKSEVTEGSKQSRRASLSSVQKVTPRKIISSAA